MRATVTINVNDYVLVRLTQHGMEVHRGNHERLFSGVKHVPPYKPPERDQAGWSRFQLWDLMSQFGASTYNGGELCFETEVVFDDGGDKRWPMLASVARKERDKAKDDLSRTLHPEDMGR